MNAKTSEQHCNAHQQRYAIKFFSLITIGEFGGVLISGNKIGVIAHPHRYLLNIELGYPNSAWRKYYYFFAAFFAAFFAGLAAFFAGAFLAAFFAAMAFISFLSE